MYRRQGATGHAQVIRGDARQLVRHIPSSARGRVALVVTSPPYWPSIHRPRPPRRRGQLQQPLQRRPGQPRAHRPRRPGRRHHADPRQLAGYPRSEAARLARPVDCRAASSGLVRFERLSLEPCSTIHRRLCRPSDDRRKWHIVSAERLLTLPARHLEFDVGGRIFAAGGGSRSLPASCRSGSGPQ